MGSDPQYAKYPDLSLAQHIFTLTNPSSTDALRQTALKKLQNGITENKMAPLYRHLAHPTEGLLNSPGEGGSQKSVPASSKASHTASKIAARLNAKPLIQIPWDEQMYEKLKKENNEELETFAKEEEEAAEKAGETEIQAARGKRAEFWARVGDKVRLLLLRKVSYRTEQGICRRKPSRRTRLSVKKRGFSEPKSILSSPSSELASFSETSSW